MGVKTRNLSNTAGIDIEWQGVQTGNFTAVAGRGYFVDTTNTAITVTLPGSPSFGDTIIINDYASTFNTNNVTINPNGNKIEADTSNGTLSTNDQTHTLVYTDSTQGWKIVNQDTTSTIQPSYISATGGTITTSGDFKIHSFTGDGCFVVSSIGNPIGGPSAVDYLVVAGGGGGGTAGGGAGGSGGLRLGAVTVPGCASPLTVPGGITVSATTYPISVGGGGAGGTPGDPAGGNAGSNSVFSTITSAGGGFGGSRSQTPKAGGTGGAGGGGGGGNNTGCTAGGTGGSGNTPPVSPPQGQPGGNGTSCTATHQGGGGGGSSGGGGNAATNGGNGGVGTPVTEIFGAAPQPFYIANSPNAGATACGVFAGGGGGGTQGCGGSVGGTGGSGGGGCGEHPGNTGDHPGTVNSGGGGGGGDFNGNCGGAGGKGIVLIRYKFQN